MGTGTPNEWSVTLRSGDVECAEDEMLRLRVQQFICFNAFPNVTADNNTISYEKLFAVDQFNDHVSYRFTADGGIAHDRFIPDGLYSAPDLAVQLRYTDDDHPDRNVDVVFDGERFSFRCLSPFSMKCDNDSALLLGFTDELERSGSFSSDLGRYVVYSDGTSIELVETRSVRQGTYTFYQLAERLTTADITCTFLEQVNGFRWTAPAAFRLAMPGTSYKLLGFPDPSPQVATLEPGTEVYALESRDVINLITVESLLLSIEGAYTHGSHNLRMDVDGTMRPSTILASIPVPSTPFEVVQYNAPSRDIFAINLLEKRLNVLKFRLEDGRHRLLVNPRHYTLTLVVETLGRPMEVSPLNNLGRKLDKLLDISRLSLLSANFLNDRSA